jgi:flagellar basal body-associated protein FliL
MPIRSALPVFFLTACIGGVMAEEAQPPVREPDPTAAIVAEGVYRYHQRDLDAFVALAKRHNGNQLTRAEEDQIRHALVAAFPAREALNQALVLLPASLTSVARDRLVLDLLDYQADPVPPQALRPAAPAEVTPVTAGEPAVMGNPATTPATTPASNPTTPAATPILVRLPQLVLPRNLDGVGDRTMTIGIAFSFTSDQVAKKLEDQSPLIQDAILGYLHGLAPAEFAQPNQIDLKAGIDAAIRAKVPTFPANAILIPELDVAEGRPATGK